MPVAVGRRLLIYNKELIGSHIITSKRLNYKEDDMVKILKTDAFKNKDDDYIESFVRKQLKIYDSIGGKKK